jgi:anti-anti-sigma factor
LYLFIPNTYCLIEVEAMVVLQSDDGNVVCVGTLRRLREEDLVQVDRQIEDALGMDCYGRTVLVDLSRLDAIDSSGFAWLIRNQLRMRREGGQMILHSASTDLREVMSRLKMELLFPIAKDRESARRLARAKRTVSKTG